MDHDARRLPPGGFLWVGFGDVGVVFIERQKQVPPFRTLSLVEGRVKARREGTTQPRG